MQCAAAAPICSKVKLVEANTPPRGVVGLGGEAADRLQQRSDGGRDGEDGGDRVMPRIVNVLVTRVACCENQVRRSVAVDTQRVVDR